VVVNHYSNLLVGWKQVKLDFFRLRILNKCKDS